MKKFSKNLYYNDTYLDPKIPDIVKIKGNMKEDLPFLVLDNLISNEECDQIVKRLLDTGSYGNVKISPTKDQSESNINKSIRNTVAFKMNDKDKTIYSKLMTDVKSKIENFFDIELGISEGLQTLGYGEGSFYKLHADNCRPDFEDGKFVKWSLTKDYRKITTILFLTESVDEIKENEIGTFKGGHLTFDYLKDINNNIVTVKPKKGRLIAFPSNPYYSHTVHNVEAGFRISLVEWYNGDWKFKLPLSYKKEESTLITFNTKIGNIQLNLPNTIDLETKEKLIKSLEEQINLF